MRSNRANLASLMVLAMIVAADLGIVREVHRSSGYFRRNLIMLAPAAILLHAAGLLAASRRGRIRLFSIGFLAAGAAVLCTFVLAITHPQTMTIDPSDPAAPREFRPGGAATSLWDSYLGYGNENIERICSIAVEYGGVESFLVALPVLAAGCGGGLLLRWASCQRPSPPQSHAR